MTVQRSLFRRTTTVVAASAAALVLAACGSGEDGGATHGGHDSTPTGSAKPSASADAGSTVRKGGNNAADTAFALGMIPHHRQALEMARLAPTRAGSAEVKKLAEEIERAQGPEIETLSGWLVAWGEQVPAEGSGHGGHDMAGMMTAEEMDGLTKSSGAAFDKAFLELMVKHHEGAVAMARTEQAGGAHGPAKELAGAVVAAQSAEIARMKSLLGTG